MFACARAVFQRFGTIVAEQGDDIIRIEQNTDATMDNVDEAHNQIVKYGKLIKGNRGLILKTFAVLFFIVIVYGTIVR